MIKNFVIDSRSFRSFDESHPITHNDLLELVDTARHCPSARNLQPLKYRLVTDKEEIEDIIASTKWATSLKDTTLPPEGHHPSAFIVVCCDTTVSEDTPYCYIDAGIASQTILLRANEMGFGGCMLASFTPKEISGNLLIPKKYKPLLVIALGTPDETVFICNVNESGSTSYYRDKANLHFVPKRALKDIVIE